MAVVWLLVQATQSFGVLAAPPRPDRPFSLSAGPAPPPSFPVSAVTPVTEPGRLTQLTVISPAQAIATTPALPHTDVPAQAPTPAVTETPNQAPDTGEESVTVIARPRGRPAPAQPWAPISSAELPSQPRWAPAPFGDRPIGDRPIGDRPIGDRPIGHRPGAARDLGVGAAARRTAFIVGSRAREAILGYGFANPDAAMGGPPRAGEEPAPGHTVVLVDDDVEAWVRERLYGGRLPAR